MLRRWIAAGLVCCLVTILLAGCQRGPEKRSAPGAVTNDHDRNEKEIIEATKRRTEELEKHNAETEALLLKWEAEDAKRKSPKVAPGAAAEKR